MISHLPVDMVDRILAFLLLGVGYTRSIEVDVIQYRHQQYGTIGLRELDSYSCEVAFSYPYYPRLQEVLPLYEATKMEAQRVISGVPYPEEVEKLLLEEYNRRVASKQSVIKFLSNQLKQEEERIQELAARSSRGALPELHQPGGLPARNQNGVSSQPAEDQVSAVDKPPDPPTGKPRHEDLSDEDKLCLAWASRDLIPYQNMEDFLNEAGYGGNESKKYISKDQFKEMLKQAGKKGILLKVKGRWRPAAQYNHPRSRSNTPELD